MHLCTPSFPISECQRDRIAACGKVPESRIVFETLTRALIFAPALHTRTFIQTVEREYD